ncbi:MAG: hypothetical protein K0Q59_5233, partial [Paenibacillus sp.]|nr:hypothetical protein [Paenibacillus sp.]
CPWHAWEFDIITGKLVVDGKVRTQIFDVTIEKFRTVRAVDGSRLFA